MVWKDMPKEPRPPARPKVNGVGTIGRIISLRTNYYEVEVKDWNIQLVHYDVVIKEPNRPELELTISKAKKMKIFETLKEENKQLFKKYRLAYDGMKSGVSVGVIPQLRDAMLFKVHVTNESGRTNLYHVTLKVVNKANLIDLYRSLRVRPGERKEFPTTIFQLIEIMFRHTSTNRYLSLGQNSFFSMGTEFGGPESLGSGMHGKQGFFASLRPAQWKDGSLLLNVDVVHAVFYDEKPVLEFMTESGIVSNEEVMRGNLGRLSLSKLKLLREKLKGLKVRVNHANNQRTYKVLDIMNEGASRQTFKVEDDKWKTVKDYFKEAYPRTTLRHPNLNVIRAAPITRTIYLPIEVCDIAKGQKVKRRAVGSSETAKFISFTAQPPRKRLTSIRSIVQKNKFSDDPMMKDLGFSILDKPIELKGRVLPAPDLTMNDNSAVKPHDGKWNINDKKFFQSKNISCWEVVNYDNWLDNHLISVFVGELIKMGSFRGMSISQPEIKHCKNDMIEKDFQAFKAAKPSLELLLVILPTETGSLYGQVKKCGDRAIKTVTQCVVTNNVRKKQPATIGNILLKINAKMGGINNTLGGNEQRLLLDRPVMIMGADVNHPPASDRSATPSVAAVVCSLDRYACKYTSEVRHQTSRKEMIEKMQEMTKNLLKSFYRATGFKPERIIMYRDGVSESQFLEVLAFELKAMRAACTSLEKAYQPGITFIVVQKRHHTRLFPVNERDGVGRNKNVPPGTLVDTGVTHPSEIDFFLCSHEGIQGTSKPTHYRVLWDDNDLTINQLQCFSYYLCHLYARCTRSVSIPTPAYYAHWAAYRGKTHLQDLCGIDHRSLVEGDEKQVIPEEKLHRAVTMDSADKTNKMYFV